MTLQWTTLGDNKNEVGRLQGLPDKTIHNLRAKLLALVNDEESPEGKCDAEQLHLIADQALINYINDPEVRKLFNKLSKAYS